MEATKSTSKPSSVFVDGIPAVLLDKAWPHIRKLLELDRGISQGVLDIDEVFTQIKELEAQLWVAVDKETDQILAAIVTEVVSEGSLRYVNALAMAGHHLSSFLEIMFGTISQWARAIGAPILRVEGRPGWERKLRQYGFRTQSVTLFKILEEVH